MCRPKGRRPVGLLHADVNAVREAARADRCVANA
jgi:hypothetical protein